MSSISLAADHLFSPMTLCFVLGALAAAFRSDLKLPEAAFTTLSIYLMLAIGLKGGADLASAPLVEIVWPAVAAIVLALLIPLWAYAVLRRLVGLSIVDAAALAAHYGSVSAVTFLAVLMVLETSGIAYEPYATALLAILEVPAIIVALLLAGSGGKSGQGLGDIVLRTLASKSVVLLLGGLCIGAIVGREGLQPVKPLFIDLFRGLLCLFLLDLGIQAARQAGTLRRGHAGVVLFALVAPVFNGVLGLFAGWLVGMSQGGAVVLATLAASASYIVAPAAVRMALPEANPALYLTAPLAITFPFNLVVGIPLFIAMAGGLF